MNQDFSAAGAHKADGVFVGKIETISPSAGATTFPSDGIIANPSPIIFLKRPDQAHPLKRLFLL